VVNYDELAELLDLQSGVVARRQVHDAGLHAHDLRRLLRRRDLVRVHDGVFVNHTGDLTWTQRAWIGVLLAWPAALCDVSALRAVDGPGRRGADTTIHVAVDRKRTVRLPAGFRLHRMSHLEDRVRWNTSPPRVRTEHALIDVATRASDALGAVATLADAVQARRTTAGRIIAAVADRDRVTDRDLLVGILTDIDQGTCSVLEHGYLTLVERPHGLPVAERQLRDSSRGPFYRDVCYLDQAQLVELDGRLGHDSALDRDSDLDRDLDAAVDRQHTVRIGWGQVFRRGCRTAARIGLLLQARGWTGQARRCPDCPDDLPVAR
jgi:hypothetical protein